MSATKTKKPTPKKTTTAPAAPARRGRTTRSAPPKTLAELQGIIGKLMVMTDRAVYSDTDTFEQLKARFKDTMAKRRQRATAKDDTRTVAEIAAATREMQEETLRFAQAVRRATGDPDGRCWSIIAGTCVFLGEDRWFHDKALADIGKRMDAVKVRAGLDEDDDFPRGEGPKEYQALNAEWEQRGDDIVAEVMREHGERAMADLYLSDPDDFYRRMDEGREKIAAEKGSRS